MVKKSALLALMLASTLAGSASAALAAGGSVSRPASNSTVIHHGLQFNGPMTALVFVSDRLLDVFRAMRGVGLVMPPTVGTGNQTNGIQDGPDGIDPLGVKQGGMNTDGPPPMNSSTPVQ